MYMQLYAIICNNIVFICMHIFIEYMHACITYMSGGQIHLLLAMDMAKAGDALPVVKVCTYMLKGRIGHG